MTRKPVANAVPKKAAKAVRPAIPPRPRLVRGRIDMNGQALSGGDAAMLMDEPAVRVSAGRDAEVLVFDLQP